jgi:sugar phosphate isomerase/epimerase
MTTAPEVLGRNRLMCGGTIGLKCTLHEQIDATAAAGYHHVSVSAHDMRALDDDALRALARYGQQRSVSLTMIDGYYPWQRMSGSKLEGKVLSLDAILHMAEILDSRFIGALALPLGHPLDSFVEGFTPSAAKVADAGRILTLEFAPVAGVTDLESALEVVRPAGFESAGIVFDTWHFNRGNPDYALLESLQGNEIKTVQFSDAAAEVQGSLWEDTIAHRLQPGDGSFDLDRLTLALEKLGVLDWYGPEVISTTMQAMGPSEAATVSARRLDEYLTRCFA